MDLLNTRKTIRYGVVFIGIFILLKVIPRANIDTRDAIISSVVLFALYVIVENVFTKASFCSNEKLDGSININSGDLNSAISSISSLASSLKTSTMSNVQSPIVQNPPSIQTPPKMMSFQPPVTSQPSMPSMPSMPSQSSQPSHSNFNNNGLKPGECKDCVKKTVDSEGMISYLYNTNAQRYESGKTREEVGTMNADNEMLYTDYFIMPITKEDEKSFEEGYSMLPPSKWYPVPPHPPVCVTDKKCPVCPVLTSGAPVDLKEWNDSRRITPGDVINIDYAKDKLNSGR